jgi:16S rRNA (adenine1518-N6/adenine1519-N6)-dimethyltransferase
MSQTKSTISALLASAGTHPKHRFGQNFMVDQNLVRTVAAAGEPGPGDLVIEVGPGTGTLTETLLASGAEVLAVEIDRDLAGVLRERLGGEARFRLIEGDALDGKHALHPELAAAIAAAVAGGGKGSGGRGVKLIANLPYNIASPLIIELLLAGVGLLVFTVQKEVADRLKAPPGGEDFGPLTVTTQMLSRVEVLRTLPPQAFWPAPKIDSSLVRLTRADRLGERARAFSAFVQQLFSFRRKMMRKALAFACDNPGEVLGRLGIEETVRCEELTPEQLLGLYEACRLVY